jgi:hypothetical protein
MPLTTVGAIKNQFFRKNRSPLSTIGFTKNQFLGVGSHEWA